MNTFPTGATAVPDDFLPILLENAGTARRRALTRVDGCGGGDEGDALQCLLGRCGFQWPAGRWDADFGSCRSGYVARVGSPTRHEPARSGDDGGARTHARSLGLQYSERRVAGRRSKVVDVTWTACRQHLSPLSPARSTSTPRTHHPRSTAQCTTTSVALSIEPTLGTRLPHHHCTPHHTRRGRSMPGKTCASGNFFAHTRVRNKC